MRAEDVGESFKLHSGDDARLLRSLGDAGGPVEIFQSRRSGNAGDIGENSTLNPDVEGVAENSNSNTHCIDGDATFLDLKGMPEALMKILSPIVQRM